MPFYIIDNTKCWIYNDALHIKSRDYALRCKHMHNREDGVIPSLSPQP